MRSGRRLCPTDHPRAELKGGDEPDMSKDTVGKGRTQGVIQQEKGMGEQG